MWIVLTRWVPAYALRTNEVHELFDELSHSLTDDIMTLSVIHWLPFNLSEDELLDLIASHTISEPQLRHLLHAQQILHKLVLNLDVTDAIAVCISEWNLHQCKDLLHTRHTR